MAASIFSSFRNFSAMPISTDTLRQRLDTAFDVVQEVNKDVDDQVVPPEKAKFLTNLANVVLNAPDILSNPAAAVETLFSETVATAATTYVSTLSTTSSEDDRSIKTLVLSILKRNAAPYESKASTKAAMKCSTNKAIDFMHRVGSYQKTDQELDVLSESLQALTLPIKDFPNMLIAAEASLRASYQEDPLSSIREALDPYIDFIQEFFERCLHNAPVDPAIEGIHQLLSLFEASLTTLDKSSITSYLQDLPRLLYPLAIAAGSASEATTDGTIENDEWIIRKFASKLATLDHSKLAEALSQATDKQKQMLHEEIYVLATIRLKWLNTTKEISRISFSKTS